MLTLYLHFAFSFQKKKKYFPEVNLCFIPSVWNVLPMHELTGLPSGSTIR